MSNMIHGREYKITETPKGVRGRVLVDGVTHQSGLPIRFKSLERAERHIVNMRLQKVDE